MSSKKYPCIRLSWRPFKQMKNPPKSDKAKANVAAQEALRLCPCGEKATGTVEVSYSYFRGDDEMENRCDAHKQCAQVKGEAP